MNVVLAVAMVAVVYGAYKIADLYVRRSLRSFATAQRASSELTATARKLIDQDIPEPAARAVLGLAAAAGCGCFVRNAMLAHYMPRLLPKESDKRDDIDLAFDALSNLSAEQKKDFDRLLGMVMVYDSFRNPLQGWFFRRMLQSFFAPEPRYTQKVERQLAAISVLSRRDELLPAH